MPALACGLSHRVFLSRLKKSPQYTRPCRSGVRLQRFCVFPAPADFALSVQPTLEELEELLPEDEPAWWQSAAEQRGNQTTARLPESNLSKSTLPGWEEVVEQETGVVSMQRVRGGQAGATAWLASSSSARVARVRGGWQEGMHSSPDPDAHGDDDEWDESGERRLNIPDSDISVDFGEEACGEDPARGARPLGPRAPSDAPADQRHTPPAIAPNSDGSRGLATSEQPCSQPGSPRAPAPAPAPATERWQEQEQENGPAPGASAVNGGSSLEPPCSKPLGVRG